MGVFGRPYASRQVYSVLPINASKHDGTALAVTSVAHTTVETRMYTAAGV